MAVIYLNYKTDHHFVLGNKKEMMSNNSSEFTIMENDTNTIWSNDTWICSMNSSEHTEYIIIPENKEGLRNCRPCILISDFNVSTFSYSMLSKITSLYLFG